MKRKILANTALLSWLALTIAVAGGLSGKWKATVKADDGNLIDVVFYFKADGEKLTGTSVSPEGVANILDGKITGDTFSFRTIGSQGIDYYMKGKIYADSCGMDVDFGDAKMHLKLLRDTTK
jgi:hypothetical protein